MDFYNNLFSKKTKYDEVYPNFSKKVVYIKLILAESILILPFEKVKINQIYPKFSVLNFSFL